MFFQPGSPPSRAYEAPTPGSGWASTPSGNYSDAGTPRDGHSAYGRLFVSWSYELVFMPFLAC